jgi:hypothetical protein
MKPKNLRDLQKEAKNDGPMLATSGIPNYARRQANKIRKEYDMLFQPGWPQSPVKNWRLYFHHWKYVLMFKLIFEIFDAQGDGFIVAVIHLFHHAFRLQMPFPGDKIKTRIRLKFPKE